MLRDLCDGTAHRIQNQTLRQGVRQPEARAEDGGSVSQRKLMTSGLSDWGPGDGRDPGVESFLTGRYQPFCAAFYSVLFCTLTFPVVCFLSLYFITKNKQIKTKKKCWYITVNVC